MARNADLKKPDPQHLKCRIKDIQPDPMLAGRRIVSVEFDDGKGKPWHQAFSVIPHEVIKVDDFINKLLTMEIRRPVDPLSHIDKIMQKDETFVLDLTAKIEPSKDNS